MADFDTKMELDITKLREERRPLFMSSLGVDHPADMIGGGGDIWSDRVVPEYPRFTGEELSEDELKTAENLSPQYPDEMKFREKSEKSKTAEEAFKYVHPSQK
jgi:hypothetical protein